jgi:putative transposase
MEDAATPCVTAADSVVHITCHCAVGERLLKFGIDRDHYCQRLKQTASDFGIEILNYVISEDHLHLVFEAESPDEITRAMKALQGSVARYLNGRLERAGKVWAGTFIPTVVQASTHLPPLLRFVDSHQVRGGYVAQPEAWGTSGYLDLAGFRKRNRIVSIAHVLRLIGLSRSGKGAFQEAHRKAIKGGLREELLLDQAYWVNEAFIGTPDWIEPIAEALKIDFKARVKDLSLPGLTDLPTQGIGVPPRHRSRVFSKLTFS